MAEIKENQNRIFPTGKLVYALSWLALIGFILKIGRLNIFFAVQNIIEEKTSDVLIPEVDISRCRNFSLRVRGTFCHGANHSKVQSTHPFSDTVFIRVFIESHAFQPGTGSGHLFQVGPAVTKT